MRPRRPLLRVAAGAATARLAYRAGRRRTQLVEDDQHQQDASPAARSTTDSTAELERLAKLHESGALDDQEFAAAKSRLLGL
jgi:hypothetical protein